MDLLEMSLTGSVMIIVVFLIRCLLLHRLPKKTFVILWGIAIICLLVPFRVVSRWSIYSLMPVEDIRVGYGGTGRADADRVGLGTNHSGMNDIKTNTMDIKDVDYMEIGYAGAKNVGADSSEAGAFDWDWMTVVSRAGSLLCAGWFLIVYLDSRRKFAESLPVQNVQVDRFFAAHKLRRKISIRQLGGIRTPLTYGIWRPVILFPAKTDWTNESGLEFMLLHEYVHIRHFDALLKLMATAALCVHWFNPLVWLLYIQCNRDIELSCDETVVHISGRQARNHYAMTLIAMAEQRSIPAPLCNGFSENSLEERIEAIMLAKRLSMGIGAAAVLLVAAVSVLFATAGERPEASVSILPEEQGEEDKGQEDMEEQDREQVSGSEGDSVLAGNVSDADGSGAEYAIKYFPEGLEETISAQPVRGNGYGMLFPADEEWVSNAPVGFTHSQNENVFLRVVVYEGMSAEQAGALLVDEGYHELEDGDYRIQRRSGDVACAEIVRLVEDVYSTYGISYGFPDTSEYEENLGAYLAAAASTFTLDTAGLSADGEALKAAAKSFGDAYLAGDGKTCLEYMSSDADTSCLQELKKGRFDFTGAKAKRLCMETVDKLQDGDEAEVQIECGNPEPGEGNLYLSITCRREGGILRVVSFGWEM